MSPIFPKMSFRAFLKSRIQSRIILLHVSQSVQSLSHVWLFSILWTGARQASLSITNSQSLLKLMSIELVMPSNHLILFYLLLLLLSIFPSIRVFSNKSVLSIRWPKYWTFSFSISPSNEYSGLISFRMDWFDGICPISSWQIDGETTEIVKDFILGGSKITADGDWSH